MYRTTGRKGVGRHGNLIGNGAGVGKPRLCLMEDPVTGPKPEEVHPSCLESGQPGSLVLDEEELDGV